MVTLEGIIAAIAMNIVTGVLAVEYLLKTASELGGLFQVVISFAIAVSLLLPWTVLAKS